MRLPTRCLDQPATPCRSRARPDHTLEHQPVMCVAARQAFRVFAVLTIPVFYLNVHGRSKRMPGFFGTAYGLLVAWLFIYYHGTLIRNMERTSTPETFMLPAPAEHKIEPIVS
jgi:hypothetical protein